MTSPHIEAIARAIDPKPTECIACDFGSGQRGMDRCCRCAGTGSVYLINGMSYPNTQDGFKQAVVALAFNMSAEICAEVASNACMVPPDGGAPTDDERAVAESAAAAIRALVKEG